MVGLVLCSIHVLLATSDGRHFVESIFTYDRILGNGGMCGPRTMPILVCAV